MNLQTKIQIAKITTAVTLSFITSLLFQRRGAPGPNSAGPYTSPELQHGQPWKAGEIPDIWSETLVLSPGLPIFFHPTASSHVSLYGSTKPGDWTAKNPFESWDWAQCAQSLQQQHRPPPLTGTRLTARPWHQANAHAAHARWTGTQAGTCGSGWGRSCRREMGADTWASLSLS